MRLRSCFLLLPLAIVLAGCAYRGPTTPIAFDDGPYRLDSGDKLRVVVFGQEGLSSSYAVDQAGRITMPLIGGVPARGLTPAQFSQSVVDRLRQGYIREPHVAAE